MTSAYLYKWEEISTGKWYIGSRTKKGCHPNDAYICSSKIVKPLIKQYPNNWKKTILIIGDPFKIRLLESELLMFINAADHPMSYNQTNGNNNWSTTGKKASIQTRTKLSLIRKGKPKSLHMRQALSKSRKGTKRTLETRQKISNALKGKPFKGDRKKLSEKLKGRKKPPFTLEHKEKLRIANKGRKLSIETRMKMKLAKQNISAETKEKIRQSKLGKKHTPETIEKIKQSNIIFS